jgi:hypothetical protein
MKPLEDNNYKDCILERIKTAVVGSQIVAEFDFNPF